MTLTVTDHEKEMKIFYLVDVSCCFFLRTAFDTNKSSQKQEKPQLSSGFHISITDMRSRTKPTQNWANFAQKTKEKSLFSKFTAAQSATS